jgi:dUTP pyrophosphatase
LFNFNNSAGVVDRDFRGNIGVVVFNHSDNTFIIEKSDRIAQLICERIAYPILEESKDEIDILSDRGKRGFGASGK